MLGKRRWWVQEEGLGLFLVIDRLLPGWPLLVFHDPSMGALELLERAVRMKSRPSRAGEQAIRTFECALRPALAAGSRRTSYQLISTRVIPPDIDLARSGDIAF